MARYKLGEIYGELRLRSKAWQKGLATNKERLKDFGVSAAKAFGLITAAAGALALALGKITKDTIRYAIEIDRMVKITGLAGEQISKLRYAIDQEHGSLQALEKGLFNLTVRLGYAGDGLISYTRYFKTLGIEHEKVDGTLRDTYDVFLDLVDVMSQGTITTETLAAAAQLLGARAAKQLIPFMKLGREEIERLGQEAEALGLVMSTKTAAGLKKVDDAIFALKGSFRGFRNLIGERIAPAVKGFAETMVNAFIEIRKNIDTLLPSLADLGSDTEMMGNIGVTFAKRTVTAIFAVMNAWTRLKTVYWTVRSVFNRLIQFHNKQYQILFETTFFTLRKIAEIWDKVFKTDIAGTLDGISEKFRQFNTIIGTEAVANWENAEQAVADLNTQYETQMAILDGLTPSTLHFSGATEKVADSMDKTLEATGKSTEKIKELKKAEDEIIQETKGMELSFDSLGASLGEFIKTGTGANAVLNQMLKLLLSVVFPGGGFLAGLFGAFGFDKGGAMLPKGVRPYFMQEGGATFVDKPSITPMGNVMAETRGEFILTPEQMMAVINRPIVFEMHHTTPMTYVNELKKADQGSLQELGRLTEKANRTQEKLG